MRTYYDILGVKNTDSEDEIKKVYRKLAMQYHPDRNPGDKEAERRFKEINEAYETLKDANKKAKYDSDLNRHNFSNKTKINKDARPFSNHNEAWDFIKRRMYGNHHRNDEWDIKPKNDDFYISYEATLEEFFNGTKTTVNYKLPGGPAEKVDLVIKPGMVPGLKVRYKNRGGTTYKDVESGDLYVTLIQKPHTRFIRHNEHLSTSVSISYLDAILGTHVYVTTIDDSLIKVNIPSGFEIGKSLKVPGKGMFLEDGKTRGDLMIDVLITMPKNLTPEHITAIQAIRDDLTKK